MMYSHARPWGSTPPRLHTSFRTSLGASNTKAGCKFNPPTEASQLEREYPYVANRQISRACRGGVHKRFALGRLTSRI